MPETNQPRINKIVETLLDILSSGNGFECPSEYHERAVPELWEEECVTQEEKQAVFHAVYDEPSDYVSIEEIRWMMEECGVDTVTITISTKNIS